METLEIKLGAQHTYSVAESFKTLRTNVQFSGDNIKAILITSCLQNDGKTTVSFELAKSLAEDGKKVLYIDADLRKSVLMRRLIGRSNVVDGLSSYLTGMRSFDEVCFATQVDNLHIIFAGQVPPNPAELLGNKHFKELCERKNEYDYLIIDTPPLGAVIDSAVIARVCDAAIIVIAADNISRKFAASVKDQLEKSDCPIIGTVMNRVEMQKTKYYGGYRYKYKRRYGKYGGYGYGNYGYGNYGYGNYGYGHYGYGNYGYGNYGHYGNENTKAPEAKPEKK